MKLNKQVQLKIRRVKSSIFRRIRNSLRPVEKFNRKLRFYAQMEAKRALLLTLKYTHGQISIRPRIRLSAKFLLASILILLVANYAVAYLKPKAAEIKIKGQSILVASEPEQKNVEAEFELDQAVVARLSPFEFNKPVENGYLSQGYNSYHRANDIASSFGAPIRPLGSGIVEFAGFTSDGKGNIVIVSHGDGLKSLYAHMDKIMVGSGNMVNPSTVIGTIGLTGRTTGPHVHMEIYDGGNMVDPTSVLPQN